MTWDIVATVKESPEVMERFVAHHLMMGVHRIWLFFDDPEDGSVEKLGALDAVQVIRCDTAFWSERGGLPRTIERKQMRNAREAYRRSSADWIAHIDSDEFIEADRPMAQILSEATEPVLRLAPFEMLHFARSGRTAEQTHMFRAPLPVTEEGAAIAEAAYGPFEKVLRRGMLSHIAGKFFVRTGIEGALLRIHVPEIDGHRVGGVTAEGARLLHLHGGDWQEWRGKMRMRLKRGAYTAKQDQRKSLRLGKEATINHVLYDLLGTEGEAGLKRFYDRVCSFDRSKRVLRQCGALHRSSMWLDQKRASIFGYPSNFRDMAISPESGELEAVVETDGVQVCIHPDGSVAERAVALGLWRETDDVKTVLSEVSGRKALCIHIGATAQVIGLKAVASASKGSKSIIVARNGAYAAALEKSLSLNKMPAGRAQVINAAGADPITALEAAGKASVTLTPDQMSQFEVTMLEAALDDADQTDIDGLVTMAQGAGFSLIYLANPLSQKSRDFAARCLENGRYVPHSEGVLRAVMSADAP